MHKTSRTSLIAVLAAALVLSVGSIWSTGAQAAPVATKDTKDTSPYTRAEATKILDQVQAALAPKKLAARRLGDPLPRRDLGLLMHKLQVAKSALSADQQKSADVANSRPVPIATGCTEYSGGILQPTWKVLQSTHFCLHYIDGGSRGTTPYWANATLDVLEHVYATEVTGLGYRKPLNDGDGKYDVFLDQIGNQGYYGFCTTDTGAATSSAWCELDNDFAKSEFGAEPGDSLRVTAAHEFFHAVQFAYDANDSTWFLEGTAVWMEDQVYPSINDYLQYLQYSQIKQSQVPIDTAGSFERYGAVIFWKYLSEGYHSVDIVHQIWYAAGVSNGSKNGIQATISVLKAKHVNFADAFARFSVWNTLPPGTYADRALFPNPVPWGTAKLSTAARDTNTQNITIDHLANATVILIPSSALPTKTRLKITVDAPNDIVGKVRIQERKLNGSVVYTTMTLHSNGNGASTIYFSGKNTASVRVTMANVTTSADNQVFKFRAIAILP